MRNHRVKMEEKTGTQTGKQRSRDTRVLEGIGHLRKYEAF